MSSEEWVETALSHELSERSESELLLLWGQPGRPARLRWLRGLLGAWMPRKPSVGRSLCAASSTRPHRG